MATVTTRLPLLSTVIIARNATTDVKSSSNIIAFLQKPGDLQMDRSQIVVAISAFSQNSHFKVTDHI